MSVTIKAIMLGGVIMSVIMLSVAAPVFLAMIEIKHEILLNKYICFSLQQNIEHEQTVIFL
jgi:hypothetical protein